VGTLRLLENLLAWSRIQTGQTQPQPGNIDISSVVEQTISYYQDQLNKKNISLNNNIPFGIIAFCDEQMGITVIRNLISNAIKFTPEDGKVRIGASSNDKFVEVSVADNGVGIEPEDLEKLFRIDETFKTRGTEGDKGSGLGLILSREYVEMNGGTIHAESTPGKGSTFTFTLPVIPVLR